jgi:hypothetical protein
MTHESHLLTILNLFCKLATTLVNKGVLIVIQKDIQDIL